MACSLIPQNSHLWEDFIIDMLVTIGQNFLAIG
jgi:hypothetical protein